MLLEKVSILYVEDDGEIREALAETLEFDVKELYVAENGEEGLKKFKEFKPDIVISDIKMPKMDGLQMSAQIKEISPKTPIIITTAFSDSDYLLKAIDIGIDKYVTKPVDIDKLYKALEDITSLLLIEKEREIRNKYLKDILDFNPNFILIAENKKVEYINKTFLNFLGFNSYKEFKNAMPTSDEIIEKITDMSGNSYPNNDWMKRIIYNPNINHIIYFKHKSNKPFIVLQNSFKDLKKDILLFSDITNLELNRLKLEEQVKNLQSENDTKSKILKMQSKNALMGEMIAAIAHQLKQPLTALSLNVDVIDEDIISDDEMLQFCAENSKKQIDYMIKTIDGFRNFLSPQKKIETFFIKDIINEVKELLIKSLKLKDVKLTINNGNIKVTLDKDTLRQVLLNIIKNAIDAFKLENSGNEIIVSVFDENDFVKILIEDNGGGISDEVMKHIFTPYFTTKEDGTGIGLYISQLLIEDMGGKISVDSKNGKTQFKIILKKG